MSPAITVTGAVSVSVAGHVTFAGRTAWGVFRAELLLGLEPMTKVTTIGRTFLMPNFIGASGNGVGIAASGSSAEKGRNVHGSAIVHTET